MSAPAMPSFLEAISPQSKVSENSPIINLAEEELRVARIEADRIRAAARTEGYAQGMASAHTEMRPLLVSLGNLISVADQKLADREEIIARTSIELGMQVASLAVNRHLELANDAVVDAARAALARVREGGNLRLHVSPKDALQIREALQELEEIMGVLTVIEDLTVEEGGARVVCHDGEYDAQPSEQLARLQEAIVRALAEDI
jgi:flagellar assembly protein FliH